MSGYGRGMSGRVDWDMVTESKKRERRRRRRRYGSCMMNAR